MKLSISQFEKLKSIKFIFIAIVFVCFLFECTGTKDESLVSDTQVLLPVSGQFKEVKLSADGSKNIGLEFQKISCPSSKKISSLQWKLKFSSPFGDHFVRVAYDDDRLVSLFKKDNKDLGIDDNSDDSTKDIVKQSSLNSDKSFKMVIDSSVIESDSLKKFSLSNIQSLCDNFTFSDEKDAEDTIQSWLSAISSDCSFSLDANGWKCSFEPLSSELILKELDEIRRLAIRRWNRHPYLLARKIAITIQLSSIVQVYDSKMSDGKNLESSFSYDVQNFSNDKEFDSSDTYSPNASDIEESSYATTDINDDNSTSSYPDESYSLNSLEQKLNVFCSMLKFSDKQELPIVMSEGWSNKLCSMNTSFSKKMELAHIGISKAFSEIDFLKNLIDRTSNLGLFSIHFPRSTVKTNYFTVSLQPEENVSQAIAEQSLAIVEKEILSSEDNQKYRQSCWNPAFTDLNSFNIAKSLNIVGESPDIECSFVGSINKDSYSSLVSKFLTDSVTSETEFLISNGNSKLLRLPPGTYSYTIREFYNGNQEEDIPMGYIVGKIVWSKRKPNVSVREWKLSQYILKKDLPVQYSLKDNANGSSLRNN